MIEKQNATGNALILVFGVPCAGKSTFCKKIVEGVQNEEFWSNKHVLHLEVDLLESLISKGLKMPESVKDFDELFTKLREESYQFDRNSSEKARGLVLEIVQDLFKKQTGSSPQTSLVILVDDNNLKRGARRRFLNVCRKSLVAFAEVFIDEPLDKVLERNLKRTEKHFSPEVILKDFNELQVEAKKDVIRVSSATKVETELLNQIECTFANCLERFKELDALESQSDVTYEKSFLSRIEEGMKCEVSQFIRSSAVKFKNDFHLGEKISAFKKDYYQKIKQNLKGVDQEMSETEIEGLLTDFREKLLELLE